ncbi:Methyltransferase-like protein [Seminavis robusta]|uniref:Methyltransferase-like protein n=1 Tax=Seminavis robusta TaxID=568900 RepID=A0A9N8HUM3_9STRA|nr:Methyltransferase-like protein [Seminavis robusta]|eukprot:Sro1842_g301090.1 Methyltransferase-like protein (281) ;mRNA; r:16081-16923
MSTEIVPASAPFLSIGDDKEENGSGIPIYFEEDWNQGIGGGLWSTGLAFSRYLTTPHANANLQKMADSSIGRSSTAGLSVLELGSGNGLLSVCLLALSKQLLAKTSSTGTQACIIRDLVITDLADHLPLIQKTLDANSHLLQVQGEAQSATTNVHVLDHSWGSFLPSSTSASEEADTNKAPITFSEQVQQGQIQFDLIVGSDVAYREDLYDILITSLQQFAHDNTCILIGCTMNDTKPEFFHKLRTAGFRYQKFADHLLERDFQGQTFGIFVIERVKQEK